MNVDGKGQHGCCIPCTTVQFSKESLFVTLFELVNDQALSKIPATSEHLQ